MTVPLSLSLCQTRAVCGMKLSLVIAVMLCGCGVLMLISIGYYFMLEKDNRNLLLTLDTPDVGDLSELFERHRR